MKQLSALLVLLVSIGAVPVAPALVAPGLYRSTEGHLVYVGVEHELPDARANEFFDATNGHTGDSYGAALTLVQAPREVRRVVRTAYGRLGVSLWTCGPGKRPTLLMVHGNDPETREMGMLVAYFASNGVNVIAFDQRGTGESSGDWSKSGPGQRALDVEALFDAYATDPHVDAKRFGVFGFSNGGWTAPIVAAHRPLAFMILKSAPAETLDANIIYEVRQRMYQRGYQGAPIAAAVQTWRALLDALAGRISWDRAQPVYLRAIGKPWFGAAFLPKLTFPITRDVVASLRRAVSYDPGPTLRTVRTPTLAVFGALDRNVDSRHARGAFAAAFAQAGMRDFTEVVYPHAGHTLKISLTGFNGYPENPERFAPGYPGVMLAWLKKRDLTAPCATPSAARRL